MAPKEQMFRPYLTAEELMYLCSTLADTSADSKLVKKLYTKLYTLALKIDAGLVSASYTSTGTASTQDTLLSSLGAASSMLPAAKRLAAYEAKVAGKVLSPEELELAETYEWENNINTAEEV